MAAPGFDQYLAYAKSKVPDATDDDIKAAYRQKYGQDPVSTQGPTLDQFSAYARQNVPDATDEDITEAYDRRYGASAWQTLKRGVKSGFAEGGKFIGGMVGGLEDAATRGGALGLAGLGAAGGAAYRRAAEGTLGGLGQSIYDYWQGAQEANAPATALQGNVIDRPGLLAKPAYWAQVPAGLASLALQPQSLLASPAQHFVERDINGAPLWKNLPALAAEEVLNVIPGVRMAAGVPGRLVNAGLMGAAEGAMPILDAAASGGDMGDALKQGATAFPVGAVMGGLMAPTREGPRTTQDFVEQELGAMVDDGEAPGATAAQPPSGAQPPLGGEPQPAAQQRPPLSLRIEPAAELDDNFRTIETRFAEQITADPEAAAEAYAKLEGAKGGKILNTDTARELSEDYLKDRTLSAAVHEPASALIKAMYERKLAEAPGPGEDPLALFSAGGTGAGKSSGLDVIPAEVARAQVVMDTNMNTLASGQKKIEQALAAGKNVTIVYTYREPIEALRNGAFKRAMRQERKYGSGRTVPLEEHLKTHIGSAQVIRQLADIYRDDGRVQIVGIDNSRGPGNAIVSRIEDLPQLDDAAYNRLREEARAALEDARATGAISQAVYRGFGGQAPHPEPALGAIDRGQPEQAGQVRVGRPVGDPYEVSTITGSRMPVRPEIIDAADLVTSEMDGYPAELQPRDRSRAGSEAQVLEIAQSMGRNPAIFGNTLTADDGAPIIAGRNNVVSGNGRTQAARLMYERMPEAAAKYRAWLESQGADISGMRMPILVRRVQGEGGAGDLVRFAAEANMPRTLEYGPTERARNDAAALDADALSGMRGIDFAQRQNADFVRAFLARLPVNERAGMLDAAGSISAAGVRRIQAAVLARAYGGSDSGNATLARLLESPHDEIRGITRAMLEAAPDVARLRAEVDAGNVPQALNFAPALTRAVEKIAEIKSGRKSIQDHLLQVDALADDVDPRANDIIRVLSDGERIVSAPKIVDMLRTIAKGAQEQNINQGSLDLGIEKPNLEQIIASARRTDGGAQPSQGGLFEPSAFARRAYRGSKVSAGQMAFDFSKVETRPDANPKTTADSMAAIKDLLAWRDRGKVNVVALGITRDFQRGGNTSLVGRAVSGMRDLAIIAQVYRDPRFETLRAFYVKGGRIIEQSAITSRLAGAVNFAPIEQMRVLERAKQLGADFYLMHNHPSGTPIASDGDLWMHSRFIGERGYLGHVIINHKAYGFMPPRAATAEVGKIDTTYDPDANPEIPHPALGKTTFDAPKIAAIMQAAARPAGHTTLVAINGMGVVRAIAHFPNELLSSSKSATLRAVSGGAGLQTRRRVDVGADVIARVERFKRGSGGSYVFAIADETAHLGPMIENGLIENAADAGGNMLRDWSENPAKRLISERLPAYSLGETTIWGDGQRVDVGGGAYSWRQHGRITREEFGVLSGVMADLDDAVAAQRGGREPRTWSQNEAEALRLIHEKTGITLDGLVNRKAGSAANAAQLEAYAMLLNHGSKRVAELASKAIETGSHEDLLALAAAREKLGLMLAPAMGYKTEAGRALNILRKMAGDLKQADKLMAELGDGSRDSLLDFAKRVKEVGNVDQLIGVTMSSYRPTWWDKFYEYWVNGLLSGPKTHAVNITSNALFQALETASEGIAALTSRHVTMREVAARTSAAMHGGILGLANAKKALLTGESEIGGSQIEHRKAIEGAKGEIIRTPSKLLMAEDEFFKTVAYQAELAQLAMREAMAAGGDPRANFAKIMGQIHGRRDLIQKARERARRLTFQDPLGPIASAVSSALNKSKVGRLIVPFIRTPTNILKRAVEYTPGGFAMQSVRDALSGGGRDAAVARARMMVGSTVMLSAVSLAAAGMISGAGPADDNEKRLLMQTGWKPYSAKVGDQWVQYSRFDPVGSLLGIAADLYELGHYVEAGELDKIGSMLVTSIALNVTNKTFLKGITDYSQAMADPGRHFARWAQGMVASGVPNVLAQAGREMDPYQREARGMVQAIQEKIPGVREKLARRIDMGGEPIRNTGTGFGSPITASQVQQAPLAEAMLRVGLYKGPPSRRITYRGNTMDLQGKEYESLATFVGQARTRTLTPLVQSPQFRALQQRDSEAARSVLEKQWDEVSRQARDAWIFRNPEVILRAARTPRSRHVGSNYLQPGA